MDNIEDAYLKLYSDISISRDIVESCDRIIEDMKTFQSLVSKDENIVDIDVELYEGNFKAFANNFGRFQHMCGIMHSIIMIEQGRNGEGGGIRRILK